MLYSEVVIMVKMFGKCYKTPIERLYIEKL